LGTGTRWRRNIFTQMPYRHRVIDRPRLSCPALTDIDGLQSRKTVSVLVWDYPTRSHSYLCVGFSVRRFANLTLISSRHSAVFSLQKTIPKASPLSDLYSLHASESPAPQTRIYASPLSAQSEDAFHFLIHSLFDISGRHTRANHRPGLERCIERATESPLNTWETEKLE